MRTSSLRLGRRSIHITSDNLHQARILRRACRDVVGTLENLEGRQLLTGVVEWLMNEGPNGVLLNDTAPDGVPQTGDVYNGGSLGATWVPNRNGTAGSALQLDGVDNYINASEDLSPILGNTGSVSFWLRTTATGSDDPRVTASVVGTGAASDVPENDIFWGYLTANGRIAFQVPGTFPAGGKTTVVSTRPVNDGTWHHIAMTRDTTTGQIKIFVDGLLNDSGNANQDSKVSAPIRNVGQTLQRAGGTNYFNGQIDEFRVDNEALTDQQVALQYDPTGQPPQTPVNPTVAYTGSRAVRVSWTDAPGSESFFEFQVSTNNGATWTNAASTPVTPTSAFVTGLTPNTPYQIRMRSVNPFGQSPYTAPISVTTTPVPANGTGNGLLGVYFDNDNDNIPGNSTGKIAARIDPNIAVDWGTGVPHPAIGPDTFAVQWTGEIQPLYSEPYTFFSRSDDGFFFWLTRQDGTEVQIINDPRYQGIAAPPGFMGVPIDLVAGQRYKIRAEMFEGGGGAGAFLAWQSPSQPYENVPQSQLYSPVQAVPNAAPSGLTAAAAGPFGITLNWTDTSNNEIGFIVERSSTAGGTFAEVARVAGTTYTDPVFPQNTWHYRVRAFTLAGQSNPSNTASATTPSIPVEPGILGSYFNAGGATPVIPDEPAGTRVDATINTGDNHAFPGVGMDGFAIRWEGTLTIPTTGNYTFFPTTDDGVRLWVNGRAASLNWVERGPTEDTSPVFAFTAGQRVPIVMDMYENGGGAAAQLRWSATDAGGGVIVAKDFIPQTAWNTQVSAPAAPTNVATTTTPTSVTINWTDVALNEHSYLIQQSADGVNWTTLSRLLPISNLNGAPAPGTFTISGLRPNTQYQFRVLNRSVAGQGIAPVTVTTSVAPAGQMAGTETTPLSGDTNLTTEGTLDWAHWGYNNDPAGFNTRETPGSPRAVVQAAGANYIIWEAENGIISDPDGDNATWRVIRTGDQRWAGTTTTPSGGLALRADDGNQNPVSGFVTYTIDVAQPGTYKLYVRRKTDGGGGDNSMFVAPTLNTSGAGGVGQTQWDNQSFNPNDYVWTASDGLTPPGTTANNPVSYTIATPGRYTLALGIREQNYVIDRVALVDASLQMQGPQLDALVNSGEIGLPRTGGGPISNFTVLGTAPVQAVDATGKTYTWTNGTPNFAVAGTSDAVAVTGANNGFRFTVPASSAARRRVRVYVGVNGGTGRLTATLSDGSAAPFTDTLTSAAGQQNAVYELTYRSGLPTESLTIEWVSQDAGQVILHGVSLADLDAPAAPTDLTATPFFANRVALRWTDVAVNETEYVVLRRTGSTGEFQQIATLPANSRAYIDNGPFTPNTLYQYEVRARGAQGTSNAATASATTGQATTTVFDFQGFPDATNLLINNAPETSVVDNRLRLTNNANDQEGSAYYAQQVDVSKNFETIFDFQVQMGNGADGFVWMLQRQAATALGGGGGSLGYAGIQPSVAIKYDFYDNIDHTGLYLNGAMNDAVGTEANQGQNLRPFGINLDGGTVYRAHIMYINGRLLNTITDVNNPANSFSIEYPIDLAATLGGNMAWIGFSGATGGLNARQEILNWKYADAPAGPADITLTGTAASDNFFVRRSGGNLQVWQNADGSGTPIATIPMPVSQTVRIDGLDGDDTITLDMSGGDITLGGLNILASNGNDKVRLINGDGRVLNIGGLPVINGEFLDLGTADLKLTGVQASAVEALLASARNGTPRWQGPGIGTSAAGTDTGLAPVQQGGDTLVKFTWNGDVNGDGRINADDYFEIDSGFLDPPADPTYADGDFNFDNRINADDYFLIDSAFLGQTGILSSSSAASAVTSTSATPAIPDNQGTKRAKRVANANSALFGSTRIEKKVRRARG